MALSSPTIGAVAMRIFLFFILGAILGAASVGTTRHLQFARLNSAAPPDYVVSPRVIPEVHDLASDTRETVERTVPGDTEAAIAALAPLREPHALLAAATATLELVGNDEHGVARVAAELPARLRFAFTIDALVARAASDPSAALEAAIALGPTHVRVALPGIAETAAGRDPLAALDGVLSIADGNVAAAYESALLDAWASIDANAALDYLAFAARELRSDGATVLETIAAAAPAQLLTSLGRLPPALRSTAERAALSALGELDPEAAVAYMLALPEARRTNELLETVALSYARVDADSALAWVRSLSPPSFVALEGAIAGIAVHDFDRALSLMLERLARGPQGRFVASETTGLAGGMLTAAAEVDTFRLRRLTEALLDFESANAVSTLNATLDRWAQADPKGVVDWTIANAARLAALERSVIASTAERVARVNPPAATGAVDRVPAAQAADWIRGTAEGLLEHDPEAALRFLESHRSHPIYEETFRSAITSLSFTYPEEATRLLVARREDSQEYLWALGLVLGGWFGDPGAGAEFASTIHDEETRRAGIMNNVQLWAFVAPSAARDWILALPADDARDAAITVFMTANAASGSIDEGLLDAFSSASAREAGVAPVIAQIAKTNPAAARRLLERHIADPVLYRNTKRELARTAGALR